VHFPLKPVDPKTFNDIVVDYTWSCQLLAETELSVGPESRILLANSFFTHACRGGLDVIRKKFNFSKEVELLAALAPYLYKGRLIR
jgi:hypothetical protein